MPTLLITRPRYDITTFYLYTWSKIIINLAIAKNFHVIDLSEKRANRKDLTGIIRKTNPGLAVFNGHGNASVISGQNDEKLIVAGENEELLKGKIVYAVSCRTAKILGPRSIRKMTKCYIGYAEDFIFIIHKEYRTRHLNDPWARLFLEPSNQIPGSIIKGHTGGQAYDRAKDSYLRNIQKLITGNPEDNFLIPHLIWDMENLAFYGDKSATV